MQPPIYMDTMVSSPHFPRQEGSLDATSRIILPDLKRTGIRSKYSKKWRPPVVDVTGKITNTYLHESNEKLKILAKSSSETLLADNSFNMPHRVQLNKLLIKLDKKRETHLMKTRSQLSTQSKSFGFDCIHSDSLCLSPSELFDRSQQLNTMKSRYESRNCSHSNYMNSFSRTS
jgi:hypothetical protein